MSMKLRAQNMKNARDQTRRLEEDNRKMEERLRELKTVMTREKEERGRQGGGFWGRGQTQAGSLTKYADEVLNSKAERPPREGKKKKIKVLQDEPIELPKRSAQPGTMKYIAQRKLPQGPGPVPKDKQKGPKCGQCEDRTATLSCVQCSEIYCAGCFAAFHVKGALKQHRSVPVSASGPRVCMSPHPSLEPQQSPRGSQASGSVVSHSASLNEGSGASSARQPPMGQVGAGGSLLDGAYDESQSAASFQAALMAWREGPSSSPSASSNSSSPSKDSSRSGETNQSKRVVASPVKSPVIAVDESTGTPEQSRVPEIKFTSTLSYADRLLLKKHRRTELAEVSTPRLGNHSPPSNGAGDQSQQMVDARSYRPASVSRSSGSLSRREAQPVSSRRIQNEREATFVDDGERVNFQSLFEAVTSSESPDMLSARRSHSSTSTVSITEIKSNQFMEHPQYKTSATCVVEEARPMEAWNIQQKSSQISSATFVKDSSRSNTYSSKPRNTITDMFPQQSVSHKDNYHAIPSSAQSVRPGSNAQQQQVLQNKGDKQQPEEIDLHDRLAHALDAEEQTTSRSTLSSRSLLHREEKHSINGDSAGTGPTVQSAERKSAKPGQRPKSGMSSRPKSSALGSRPGSRAQSRAASRMKIEGVLTKAPSSALSQVAQMMQSTDHTYTYQSPLEEFFLAGVEGQPPEEAAEGRVLTPSKGRKPTSASRPQSRANRALSAKEEKFKISYKLYKMSPKSWRPDSSLGDSVPLNEVKLDEPQEEMTMSYSYSGQINGQATEWRPASSHSRLQDTYDINSSLVFGDEMFAEDAAAARAVTPTPAAFVAGNKTPLHSGRLTPTTPQNVSRYSGRSDDGTREDDDATPTPSLSTRRKSANRRSVTSGDGGGGANTPTLVSRSSTGQRSFIRDEAKDSNTENIARRSANLRRNLIGSGNAKGVKQASALPSKTMFPVPLSKQHGSREKSLISESGEAIPRSSSTGSARSAQLSRRSLKTSAEQNSGVSTDSQRLTSAQTKKESQDGLMKSGRLDSSVTKSGSNPNNSLNLTRENSRSGIVRETTSASKQGTSLASGLRRNASDTNACSNLKRSQLPVQSNSQSHSRPASTSHTSMSGHRQQTPVQQWRPNSSTGGSGEPARGSKQEISLRASMEGESHLHKDTVIADMLHSRIQADGWMDEDDDDDDVDDESDIDDDESGMMGFSHNYDDGNDLSLMHLQMSQRMSARLRHDQGKGDISSALKSSQHWETEVRPFSSRSSIASSRAGNSSARHPAPASGGGGDKSRRTKEKSNSDLRPSSVRPSSSMSLASGRESRAIVMDGEDLSMYDTVGADEEQDTEDRNTLERLEWELASDTGRLTADGQISRMSFLENEDGPGSGSSSRSSAKSLKSSEKDYDVTSKLLEDERHARDEVDELEMRRSVTLDEDEVKALR